MQGFVFWGSSTWALTRDLRVACKFQSRLKLGVRLPKLFGEVPGCRLGQKIFVELSALKAYVPYRRDK